MKFGGTSVQDATAFARVATIVTGEKENSPVVVTSAMSKVTDALLFAFELAKKDEPDKAIESLEPHFERHLAVAKELIGAEAQAKFADELQKFDEVVEGKTKNGEAFKIFVDPKAVMFILGTRMEYQEDKFKSGFEFVNPNEKGRCGCGESFTV